MDNSTQHEKILRLNLAAAFAALAFTVSYFNLVKVQGFLSFDLKDAVIALASLLLGPGTALSLSLIVPAIESVTFGTTAFYGFLMDVISSLTFSLPASVIYKKKKTASGAILGLSSGILLGVSAMMLANLLITPLYTGAPREAIVGMLLPLLLPFNLAKTTVNAALVLLLYKPISNALKAARLFKGIPKWELDRSTVLMLIAAVVSTAVGIGLLIYLI